jgi:3-isopropylmalate/(R)-2-methylmalate dehydratase small subunit
LKRFGIKAIIGETFGEIFRGNCGSIGLVCVNISEENAHEIKGMLSNKEDLEMSLCLETSSISIDNKTFAVNINEALRHRFVEGTWDTLTELMSNMNLIEALENKLPNFN